MVARLAAELPSPDGAAERLFLGDRLRRFTRALSDSFDAAYHRRMGHRPCRDIDLRDTFEVWTDCWLRGDPRATLRDWVRAYLETFAREHGQPTAWRAAAILRGEPQAPLQLAGLARAAGCSRSVLTRSFRHEYGRSVREFHQLLRVRRALDLLTRTADSVECIARVVGYDSTPNLYQAVARFTQLTPGEIRRVHPSVVSSLLDGPCHDGPRRIATSRSEQRPDIVLARKPADMPPLS